MEWENQTKTATEVANVVLVVVLLYNTLQHREPVKSISAWENKTCHVQILIHSHYAK